MKHLKVKPFIMSILIIDRRKLLGTGGYGTVFEGQWRGIPVAVKRVDKNSAKNRNESTLLNLNHPNVIKLFHIDSDEDFKHYVLELCQASLDRIFLKDGDPQKYRGPMPTEIEVIRQLAEGLEYIHKKKLIHRNINPVNVLIWVNPITDQVLMKWSGFGLSKEVNERGTYSMSGIKGTLGWLAPEILKLLEVEEVSGSETQQRGTVKSDVFAEGLVFGYFLSKGLHLFGSRMWIQANIIENNPVYLLKIEEDDLRELIEKMLTTNPMNRISSSDVVQQLIQIMAKGRQYHYAISMADDNTPSLKQIKVDVKKILGRGGYGEVFQGEWNNNQVAVKQIPLSKVESNKREEEALQMLNHPNVIKLFHTESDSENRYYAIELCAASLDKLFFSDESAKKYRGPMPSQNDVLLQLATGLEYIHKEKIIHRDIKPENILIWVNPENTKQVLLKWADFGLSKQIVKSETYTVSKVRGAEGWFAPEILKILDDEETSLSEAKQRGTIKSDVFNEGLVFGYYLLKGRHLFGGLPESNIYRNKPVNLDKIQWQSARELIKKMIHPEPKERISSSDVAKELRHIKFDYV